MFATEVWVERILRPEVLVPFCLFGLPILMWGIKSIVSAGSHARVIEAELQLKRELVAQGRSAEDIERIMGTSAAAKLDA